MKLNPTTILLLITLLTPTICFRDKIDYKDINFELINLLDEVKEFLPVSMLIKTIEDFALNSREMEIELESCYLNITAKTHFLDKEEFDVLQRKCLADFFNFFSLFQILRNIMYQFFGANCPEEFLDTCKDFLTRFEDLAERVEQQDQAFCEFIVATDEQYKRLEENFSLLKPDTVHRVVMNSILNINKENFYQQLNDVLQISDQNSLMDELGEEHVDEINIVDKDVSQIDVFFDNKPGIRSDPMMHPSKYLLKFGDREPIEDLKIVFKNEENDSKLLN